jgi:hypothetical protein
MKNVSRIGIMAGTVIALLAFNAGAAEPARAGGGTSNAAVSLTLPAEIPFRLALPRNGGAGYVDSREFWITNNGEDAAALTLDEARVHIADEARFALSRDASLPGDGSYLYLTLVCAQNGAEKTYVLTDSPQTTHTYWLESGESASFRISGAVSERGDFAWSDTRVTVSLTFSIEVPPAIAGAAEETAQSAMDEASGAADAEDGQNGGTAGEADPAMSGDPDSAATATPTELTAAGSKSEDGADRDSGAAAEIEYGGDAAG